ncbi:hypothetical protein GCM10020001_087520 [Nonomuraea salmonea]
MASAVRRPVGEGAAETNRTLGPGIAITTRDVAANARRLSALPMGLDFLDCAAQPVKDCPCELAEEVITFAASESSSQPSPELTYLLAGPPSKVLNLSAQAGDASAVAGIIGQFQLALGVRGADCTGPPANADNRA